MNRFGLPDIGIGIGLRTVHFGEILSGKPALDWFEVLSENFMTPPKRAARSRSTSCDAGGRTSREGPGCLRQEPLGCGGACHYTEAPVNALSAGPS